MTKALFFDVDGTLVDHRAGIVRVPDEVVREIRRVQALGHKTFLSSGRPLCMIRDDLLAIGFDGMVLCNGGQVELGGRTIFAERMGAEAARRGAAILTAEGMQYHIDASHHIFVQRDFAEARWHLRHVEDCLTLDFDRAYAFERAIKLECFPPDDIRARLHVRAARECGDLLVVGDNGTRRAFELFSPQLSKARGISVVLDQLGIAPQDAYAFGDGENDLDMFALCGTAVAMGNAVPAAQAAADIVCGRIEDGGLASILRELF